MPKTETMKIRLSTEEKQTFEKAAGLSGIAVSAWMRDRLRRAARRELQDANQPVPFLKDIEHG
jgi:uncharacterized protein (DUF1778 family)